MRKKKDVSEDHNVLAQLLSSAVPSWPSSEPHAVTHKAAYTRRHTHTIAHTSVQYVHMCSC